MLKTHILILVAIILIILITNILNHTSYEKYSEVKIEKKAGRIELEKIKYFFYFGKKKLHKTTKENYSIEASELLIIKKEGKYITINIKDKQNQLFFEFENEKKAQEFYTKLNDILNLKENF